MLGVEDPVLPELFPVSRDKMGETYGDLVRDWDRIAGVAYAEEDAFRQTLRTGTSIFDMAAQEARTAGSPKLSGEKAFEPGLLAKAHRGFLYIDEVNMLADEIVDAPGAGAGRRIVHV